MKTNRNNHSQSRQKFRAMFPEHPKGSDRHEIIRNMILYITIYCHKQDARMRYGVFLESLSLNTTFDASECEPVLIEHLKTMWMAGHIYEGKPIGDLMVLASSPNGKELLRSYENSDFEEIRGAAISNEDKLEFWFDLYECSIEFVRGSANS